VNIYLIKDGPGWAIVDTGIDGRKTREALRALMSTALGGRPITQVLVTHFHPDHMGAAGWLCQSLDVPLIMTRGEYKLSRSMRATPRGEFTALYRALYRQNGLEDECVERLLSSAHDYVSGVSPPPEQFTPISKGDVLRIGGREFHVLTGSGHSPEQAMLYQPDDRFLLCADQVLARISPNVSILAADPHADPLRGFLQSLQRLKGAVPEDVLALPGHDIPFCGIHVRIDELRKHHESRCDMIEDACHQRPMNATELVPFVFGRKFGYQQMGFAVTETLAHVNMMVGQQRLAQEMRTNGAFYKAV
jgi:glyoxylase-like metal-dependent hydrolase (beta-lactamase superfamily II)